MNQKNETLEGWKTIADFLGISEKTARRWHKKANMPVYQRGKGKKVYAFKHELIDWLGGGNYRQQEFTKQLSDKITFIFDNEKGKNLTEKWLLGTAIILLGITVIFFAFYNKGSSIKPAKEGKLLWKLQKTGLHFKLDLYNTKGTTIKTILFPTGNEIIKKEIPNWFAIGDINGDGWEDFVYFVPEEKRNTVVNIFLRDYKGDLKLYLRKSLKETAVFSGKKLTMTHIHLIRLVDIDNDGQKEIAIGLNYYFLYPSALVIYDKKLNKKKLTIIHPGWFGEIIAKDLNKDGKNELYIGATNNFLQKEKSEAVGIAIDGNFKKSTKIEFQHKKERKTTIHTDNNLKICYVRFGYNHFISKFSLWQLALLKISDKNTSNTTTFYCDKIITNTYDENSARAIFLREFIFSYMLKNCECAFWNSAYFEILGLKIPENELKRLQTVYYFNGKDWQRKFCLCNKKELEL